MIDENDTDRILCLVSGVMYVSRDFFADLTTGRPRYELSYRGNLQQPVEFKIAIYRKIITYRTYRKTRHLSRY